MSHLSGLIEALMDARLKMKEAQDALQEAQLACQIIPGNCPFVVPVFIAPEYKSKRLLIQRSAVNGCVTVDDVMDDLPMDIIKKLEEREAAQETTVSA